ncbi:hypothetical protein ACNPON_10400 [Glutamicibacter sp. AGC13]
MKMKNVELLDSIESGLITEAVSIAIRSQPEVLLDGLDYHRISDHTEPYWAFAKTWIQAAAALDKPVIARWVVDLTAAEFAYLEIQPEAAALLVNSVQEAKDFLASLIEDVSVLSDNPDAGLSKIQVRELNSAATALKQLPIPGANV